MDVATWSWAVASLAIVLLAADRLVAATDARRIRRGVAVRTRKSRAGATTGGPGFGDVVEIFQPTVRYLHEEQERRRHDLVEAGDADPDWEIDLERRIARAPRLGADDTHPEPTKGQDTRHVPGGVEQDSEREADA